MTVPPPPDFSQVDLSHIDTWIFDLDNTLYPPECDLFALMDARMTDYIVRLLSLDFAAARSLQKAWFRDDGTTLAGLMRHHDVDPVDFLTDVHDIALDRLCIDPVLVDAIGRLPGRRLIYTNGDADYAGRVVAALGLAGLFERVHDIHACRYVPKPDPLGYRALVESYGIDPARSVFFEDMARNLAPAKALGMTTVWLNNGSEGGAQVEPHSRPHSKRGPGTASHPDFIDYETPALAPFLAALFPA